MSKIRCIIVDDEPLAREGMRELLAPSTEIEIAAACCDGFEAIAACAREKPHLLLLDVQMPEIDGFEVAAAISANEFPPAIIFITAFDEYALRAFEAHALDYLLKPVDPERFQSAVARACALITAQHTGFFQQKIARLLQEQNRARAQRWLVKSGERMLILYADEVDWIETADEYAQLHAHGKKHLLRATMNMLEQQLDPEKFLRIHRSTIVNINRIKEMRSQSHGDLLLTLHDGTTLRMSRHYRHKLAGLFQNVE